MNRRIHCRYTRLGGQAVMLQPQLAANFVEQAWDAAGLLAACYRRDSLR